MFGSTANNSSSGSIFDSAASLARTPTTGSVFGSTAPSTSTPQTGSVFGSAKLETSQPGTGVFGTPSSQPATGNMFGTVKVGTSQPETGGGSGTSTSQSGVTTGTSGNTATPQPAQSGGVFGSALGVSQAQQTASTSGGSIFGQPKNQNSNQPTTSLFGTSGSLNQSSQPQQSIMGTNLSGNTLTGGLSLGQSTNQKQQQSIPGVLIDTSNIRETTRFNDLKEELQKQIMDVDSMIQNQIQLKHDCDAIMPAHDSQLAQIPADVGFCQRKLTGVDSAADTDIQAIWAVQKLIKKDSEAAKLGFAAIDILRLPPQYHTPRVWSSKINNNRGSDETEDIVGFFSQTADELGAKLTMYQKHLTEIEQHLRGVEVNSAQQINTLLAKKNGSSVPEESSYEQLTGVLRDFETGLLNVAGKVGETRKIITALQLNQFGRPSINPRFGNRNGDY